MGLKKNGFTLVEVLLVVAILAILFTLSLISFLPQVAKARDARRKADLSGMKKALEGYLIDHLCYPDDIVCGTDFAPYFTKIPCDPINNNYYNYFYSTDSLEACKSWYKIYAKLEYEQDPIIVEMGCSAGCGPSGNYNYWISSSAEIGGARIEGENWPEIPGVPTPPPTVTPPVGVTPTPTPTPVLAATPTSTPTSPPAATSTPTSTPTLVPTVTLILPPPVDRWGCFSGSCQPLTEWCQPNYAYPNCLNLCTDPSTGLPKNECQ